MEDQVLYRFNRGQNETIYFRFYEYKGKKYLDLRIFYQPEDEAEMKPTKKGITIPIDLFSEFKKAIASCDKKIAAHA